MTPGIAETIEHLAAIERGSASAGEREAAEWIAQAFRDAGLDPVVEEEHVHGGYWWPLGLLNGLALLAAGTSRRGLRRLLAAVSLAALVDDLDHRSRWFRKLALPKRSTLNVTAQTGDPGAQHTVVLVAHHDAAHGGAVFDTTGIEAFAARFPDAFARIKRWPPLMWAVVAAPLFVLLGRRRLGAVFAGGTIAAMADIGTRDVVPGANDNLSAVAVVLELATRRYEGVRVLLVSTGSEESNSEGMQAWGARHFADLDPSRTTFVALDTLGSGHLAIPEAEGFLVPHPYTAEVKDLASRCAAEQGITAWRGLTNSFSSDAQISLHAGFPTMLLGSLNDLKLPANYHKPSDVPSNLDLGCIDDAVVLADAIVRARASVVDRSAATGASADAAGSLTT